MRHFMVDPDNEERLLKVPPRVVAAIKAEALDEAVQRVEALYPAAIIDNGMHGALRKRDVIAAIKGEQA